MVYIDNNFLKEINKVYDLLYDFNSKYRVFYKELESIKEFMFIQGYKPILNKKDKWKFKK